LVRFSPSDVTACGPPNGSFIMYSIDLTAAKKTEPAQNPSA
jgi:hypothetical protein